MTQSSDIILVVNTGSTSTKCALYQAGSEGLDCLANETMPLSPTDTGLGPRDDKDRRKARVREFLDKVLAGRSVAAVGAIGGMVPPVPSGTIRIDETFSAYCLDTPVYRHASNLAAPMAYDFSLEFGSPAFAVDPVGVDEMEDIARISGSPLFPRFSFVHALNIRATAKKLSARLGIPFESLRAVACHLGGGFSIAPVSGGKIIDSDNRMEGAPFTPERAGGVPPIPLLEACFSGEWTREDLLDRLYGRGGLFAYFGTKDLKEVEALRESGDKAAALVVDAMAYQVLKEIGAMASVLDFDLHGIILTGGVSKDPYLSARIIEKCGKLAPVFHYPGENENEAIAEAVLEVLSGKDKAMDWPGCVLPREKTDPLFALGWKPPRTKAAQVRRRSVEGGAVSYADIEAMAKALGPVDIAVAQAEDREVLESLAKAQEAGFAGLCHLAGEEEKILATLRSLGLDPGRFVIHPAAGPAEAAALAVRAVREGGAKILVKGSLKSEYYLKAILDKTSGLRKAPVLSNLSVFQMPSYPKLLGVSDNAILVAPGAAEKAQVVRNALPLFSALGRDPFLVAALAAVETVSEKMPATTDAAALAAMGARGEFGHCVVEGPFGYDAAIDMDCARSKGLADSKVCGRPDMILAPNLETANALGKSFKFHGEAVWGGLVLGASVPAVLNSRSDDAANRYRSLLLARIAAEGMKEDTDA